MTMNREIKITKFGDATPYERNDRISIEFTPAEVYVFREIFEERALKAKEYTAQGIERDMHDVFHTAREMWFEERRKKEEAEAEQDG